jgi:acyl carrier protein
MHSQDEIREWLVDQVAEIIAVDRRQIDTTVAFSNYGLSSKDAISLSGDLEDWLDRRLSPTLVYEYPSIDLLSAYLVKDGASGADVADERSLDASTSIKTTNGQKDNQSIIQELEEISDEEAELLLIEKLNKIDRE